MGEVEKNLGEVLWSSFNGPHEIFRALRTYPLKIYYYACTVHIQGVPKNVPYHILWYSIVTCNRIFKFFHFFLSMNILR